MADKIEATQDCAGGQMTRHYGFAEWADFARGLKGGPERAAMGAHLSMGCCECRQIVEFCGNLAALCQGMAERSVPDSVLRNALAIFPPATKTPKRFFLLPVEVVFDSFLAPAPVGFRAGRQRGWQALYRAGDCSLDLRVEPEGQSCHTWVVGQISNHTSPGTRMQGLPVYVRQGSLIVAETRSNEYGEFQMEYEQRGRLQLCVDLDNGSKRLQVPLRRLIAEMAPAVDRLHLGASLQGPGSHT